MIGRYGVGIASYGGMSLSHLALRRELAKREVSILELRNSPYPEMARAEVVRHVLASDVETVVFLDPNVEVDADGVEKLVTLAEEERGIAVFGDDDWSRALDFAAVHREVLEAVVESEKRTYSNSAVDVVWSGKTVPAVPVANPWRRNGTSLVEGHYLTDSEAFMIRAGRVVGSRVRRATGIEAKLHRRPIQFDEVNVDAPVTHEPGSRFALCIPSFGSLDPDQCHAVSKLEAAGMTVLRIHDCPWIDIARSWLSERALSLGKGVFFLDHDVLFDPNELIRTCEAALGGKLGVDSYVVAGAYCMRKAGRSIIGAFDLPPGPVTFFGEGGLQPALYSGLGFAAIPKDILESMDLPKLWMHELNRSIRPWFALDCSTGFYAGEDVSFCNRVSDVTVKMRTTGSEPEWEITHSGRPARVYIDTRVRLAHRGSYDYGLEDVGCVVPRYETLVLTGVASRDEAKKILVKVDELPTEERLDMLEHWDSKPDPGYPKSETI